MPLHPDVLRCQKALRAAGGRVVYRKTQNAPPNADGFNRGFRYELYAFPDGRHRLLHFGLAGNAIAFHRPTEGPHTIGSEIDAVLAFAEDANRIASGEKNG